MIVTLATPLYLGWPKSRITGLGLAEDGSVTEVYTEFGSRPVEITPSHAIGYELAEDGTITEVFTEFGSVSATPELVALIRKAVAA